MGSNGVLQALTIRKCKGVTGVRQKEVHEYKCTVQNSDNENPLGDDEEGLTEVGGSQAHAMEVRISGEVAAPGFEDDEAKCWQIEPICWAQGKVH